MKQIRCENCGELFEPGWKKWTQKYCDKLECQESKREKYRIAKMIYKRTYKKSMTSKKNPCLICGKDKGKNRFWCPKCHNNLESPPPFFDIAIESYFDEPLSQMEYWDCPEGGHYI